MAPVWKRRSVLVVLVAGLSSPVVSTAHGPSAAYGLGPGPTAVPSASLSTPDDYLGTGPRLLFSTSAGDQTRPARPVTINNPSSATLSITNLVISGAYAVDFVITHAPALPFTVAPGTKRTVDVGFRPVDTAVDQSARLDITTNDPVQPVHSVVLAGADAVGFEGGREPHLTDITHLAGFTDQIPKRPDKTRIPTSKDEIISPYWVAANPAQPVVLNPLARYSTRITTCGLQTAWFTPSAPTAVNNLYCFAGGTDPYGGQNQMIDPVPTGSNSFSPGSAAFGLWAERAFSDDAYNTSARYHDWRFFPAKDSTGTAIAHTWIAAVDIGTIAQGKNFDYQDEVIVMTNVDPQLPLSPGAPLPGASSLSLDFATTYPGTVADANGAGTGFTTVMPNTAGNQYDPSLIHLDNPNGVLDITSTSGTMSAQANNQLNALGETFDASREQFTITSRFAGPFTQINQGHDHQALWWGPDQNDFMKVELENNNGTPGFVVFFEQTDKQGGIPNKIIAGPISPPGLATTGFVDVYFTCDPATGSCTFAYRIASNNASDITPIGTSATPLFPMRWFNRYGLAGVLVANQASTVSFTGKFQSFAITRPS
jgi:hypothetical protein